MSVPGFPSAVKDEKEWLVEEIERSASWHEFRAEKYRDEERTAGCAQALYELADAVRALPLTHPLFLKLAEINYLYWREADVVALGSWLNKTKTLIMRVCFSSFLTPKDLIKLLVELADENLVSGRKQSPE